MTIGSDNAFALFIPVLAAFIAMSIVPAIEPAETQVLNDFDQLLASNLLPSIRSMAINWASCTSEPVV